jgi:hypothetical protein
MTITYHTHGKRFGRTAVMLQHIADSLKKGETILIADRELDRRDFIIKELRMSYKIEVDCEQVMCTTPMRVVFDVNDPSPEPGFDIDFGHEVRFGFKLKLKGPIESDMERNTVSRNPMDFYHQYPLTPEDLK